MLLKITTTHSPATDLGYLLHKHPARQQSFKLAVGQAHVFFTETTEERCTAVLLLDIDPIQLVRGKGRKKDSGFTLQQYVNDRPYAASSFLSVAISQVYGTALNGRSKDRQELADTPIPLEVRVTAVPDNSKGRLLRRLFEPLGYEIELTEHQLDPDFPDWGQSRYLTLDLRATVRLADLLSHLYVLIPVLDNFKHYYVGQHEVEKLLEKGERWLSQHPEKELITQRYLRFHRSLTQDALARLLIADGTTDQETTDESQQAEEDKLERPLSLHEQRLNTVLAVLKGSGAQRVLDLGCGEGRLLGKLLREKQFQQIVGLDISYRVLEMAQSRLRLDRLPIHQKDRIKLLHGSLTYKDNRLQGFDAAAVVEVIEHLDESRLDSFSRILFGHARPALVAMTTPNAEYNVLFESLPAGQFRHRDHRFEWTRAQFATWAEQVANRHGYAVRFLPLGPEDPAVGAPSQMGVFTRLGTA